MTLKDYAKHIAQIAQQHPKHYVANCRIFKGVQSMLYATESNNLPGYDTTQLRTQITALQEQLNPSLESVHYHNGHNKRQSISNLMACCLKTCLGRIDTFECSANLLDSLHEAWAKQSKYNSITALAQDTGYSLSYLSRIFKRQRTGLTVECYCWICKALELDAAAYIGAYMDTLTSNKHKHPANMTPYMAEQ